MSLGVGNAGLSGGRNMDKGKIVACAARVSGRLCHLAIAPTVAARQQLVPSGHSSRGRPPAPHIRGLLGPFPLPVGQGLSLHE